jgi:SAM-dependent methyltransferase
MLKRGSWRFRWFGGVQQILALPGVYSVFRRMIGGGGVTVYVAEHIRPQLGNRILDVGCGPGDILDYLPAVDYVGLDCSAEYIHSARNRFGSRGRFVLARISEADVDRPGTYDLVLATGVLHHLDDSEALALFRLARQALQPDGRLVTLDGCYEQGQATLARLLLRMDRGKFVRKRAAYVELASQVFPVVETRVRHDLLRMPYTHLIMECRCPIADPSPSAAATAVLQEGAE